MFQDLCLLCAESFSFLRSSLGHTRLRRRQLRKWDIYDDYEDDCSFCRYHRSSGRCKGVSHKRLVLHVVTLPDDVFLQPLRKPTEYLEFMWSCGTSLWYFFGDDEDHKKGTIGYAYQVQPKLDDTDWNLIRQWVHGCLQRHQSGCICRDPFDLPGFEVIDCNTRKLVLWDKKADFVALSYVWGSTQTQADRTILPNPFPESVIEDALICTLTLGIRYLWVDRYCIDQEGTNETKQRLIQSMDKIYSAAKVTIINVAGIDASIGLPGVSETLRISFSKMVIDSHTMIPVVNPNDEISSSKWATRGWTLQEGLLARRRLVFTNTGVYFQCTQSHYVEGLSGEFHSKERQWVRATAGTPQPRLETQAFPSSVIGSESSSFSMESVCNDFGRRDLKTDEDILNACSGIFSRFWTGTKPEYQYCGLPFRFKSDAAFAESLLWKRSDLKENDSTLPIRRSWGPSWSWLAWRCPLGFYHGYSRDTWEQFTILVDIELPRRHEEQIVMSTVSDYAGEIEQGGLFQHWLPYLRLSGWIATIRFEATQSDDNFNGSVNGYISKIQSCVGDGTILPSMWTKVLNEDEAFKSSRLLDVIFIKDDGRWIKGLVIHRIGNETAGTFEKLGTYEILHDYPEIKHVQNMSYLTVRARKNKFCPEGTADLECRFDTITLL